MPPKACELRAERAKIYDQARELGERATAEKREFTAEERASMDAWLAKMDSFAQDISRLERLDAHERVTEADVRRVSDPLPHEIDPKHQYSLCRAILGAAGGKLDGLEGETSAEIGKRVGKKPQGFFMPTGMKMSWETHSNFRVGGRAIGGRSNPERRIDDTTAGAGAVLTRWDTTWIEYLRARMVLSQLGIRTFNDMHGNFQIPSQTGIGTVTWVAESAAVSTTAQTIGQVLFQPKTVGAYTDMSRRFLEQLSIDAELFAREDLAAILARGIESAVFNGSSAPQPTGILQQSGLTVISSGTNGGAPTFEYMVQLEEALGKANADMGNLAYVTTPQGKSNLKLVPVQGLAQTSYYPIFIWAGNQVNEYPAYSTNLMPSNLTKGTGTNLSSMIFGNWSDAALAFWSGMDVLVDPYTGGPAGTLRIVVLQDCDFQVRHVASFAAITDMVTV